MFTIIPSLRKYSISLDGRVIGPRGKELKLQNQSGYLSFRFWDGNRPVPYYVHIAMLETYVGPRPKGLEGCHKNGVNTDNRIENLYWGTHSQNMLDQVTHGTHGEGGRTHCDSGHEFTKENTYFAKTPKGGSRRVCRMCRRKWVKNYRANGECP